MMSNDSTTGVENEEGAGVGEENKKWGLVKKKGYLY